MQYCDRTEAWYGDPIPDLSERRERQLQGAAEVHLLMPYLFNLSASPKLLQFRIPRLILSSLQSKHVLRVTLR